MEPLFSVAGIVRNRLWVSIGIAVATAAAIVTARDLTLDTDPMELLPDDAPAGRAYRTYVSRFGGLEQVFVLIVPGPQNEAQESHLVRAAVLLEERLASSPEVAHARAGLEEADEQFFLRFVAPRAPLLLEDGWREVVAGRIERAAIKQRVSRLKAQLTTPAGLALGPIAQHDPLGFSEKLPGFASGPDPPIHPLTSSFLAPGGRATLLMLTPRRAEMDSEGGRALITVLEDSYRQVQDEIDVPVRFLAVGGPLYAAYDEALLRRDLRRTLIGSLAGAATLVSLAFGSLATPLVLLAPLVVALAWTAGLLALVHASLSAVTLCFGAILVGLGMDYSIHLTARYHFHRSSVDDGSYVAAIEQAVRHTRAGILASALTTAAGFATLTLAEFRPLRELGYVVTVGIGAILVSVALVGPIAIHLASSPSKHQPGILWRWLGKTLDGMARASRAEPRLVVLAAAALSVGALLGLRSLSIDADVRTLRPARHPLLEAEERLVEHFGLGPQTATIVAHGHDLSEALVRADSIDRLLRRELGNGVSLSSPARFLVPQEVLEERLPQLAELPFGDAASTLEQELTAVNLDPRAFAPGLRALRALGRGEDPAPPPRASWPDWLEDSLRITDEGAWAALRLRLPENFWAEGPPDELLAQVQELAPGTSFASAAAIGAELRSLAGRDLRLLSVLAVAAMAGTVLLSFRGRWRPSLMAVSPVLLGSLWSLGAWAAFGPALDLFSLAVLPILLGIGIDDGLHVMHGARRNPSGGVVGAIRGTGPALALTTLTTSVGFGSLVLSDIPALRRGGVLVAAGVMACLLATVVVLPAIDSLCRPRTGAR